MRLQKINLHKIEEFGGHAIVVAKLKRVANLATGDDRILFNDIIFYVNTIHEVDFHLEAFYLNNYYQRHRCFDVLDRYNELYDCTMLRFLRELIHSNFQYIDRIKKLA